MVPFALRVRAEIPTTARSPELSGLLSRIRTSALALHPMQLHGEALHPFPSLEQAATSEPVHLLFPLPRAQSLRRAWCPPPSAPGSAGAVLVCTRCDPSDAPELPVLIYLLLWHHHYLTYSVFYFLTLVTLRLPLEHTGTESLIYLIYCNALRTHCEHSIIVVGWME